MSTRPSLLFYCQHSVGLGHLTRSYALCAGLAEWFRVVLVCGGPVPDDIEPPAGVEIVPLPPLGVGAGARFVSHDARFTLERAWELRAERLLETLGTVRPAVVFVELFPFGRAKFARELVPLLEHARAAGAMTACSLRDILVTARANQERHDERAARLANEHLDAVLVHSDPRFARLEDTFGAFGELRVPVRYTGFVVRGAERAPAAAREPHVLVSAGGGLVGEPLLRTAIEAHDALHARTGLRMRAIAGPLMPDAAWQHLRQMVSGRPGLELVRSVPDLGAELRSAAVAVSQAGYNTTLEVVRSGAPALVVPYATEEEDEQSRRAGRLERLGALRVLPSDELDPARLADEVERLRDFTPTRPAIDLDGVRGTCRALWDLIRGDDVPAPLVTVSSP
jgi:predicted glycosyltransferase